MVQTTIPRTKNTPVAKLPYQNTLLTKSIPVEW